MGNLLQTGLQRSVINQESLFLLQGNYSGGPTVSLMAFWRERDFDPLGRSRHTAGRAEQVLCGPAVGAAFCDPDFVILHPTRGRRYGGEGRPGPLHSGFARGAIEP